MSNCSLPNATLSFTASLLQIADICYRNFVKHVPSTPLFGGTCEYTLHYHHKKFPKSRRIPFQIPPRHSRECMRKTIIVDLIAKQHAPRCGAANRAETRKSFPPPDDPNRAETRSVHRSHLHCKTQNLRPDDPNRAETRSVHRSHLHCKTRSSQFSLSPRQDRWSALKAFTPELAKRTG